MRRAAHPVMRALRPPAAAEQSRRPSSFPRSASVEDTDDGDDDVNDGGCDIWQRGGRDPVVVIVVLMTTATMVTNVSSRQSSGAGRRRIFVSPTPSSAAGFVIRRFHHRAIVNTFAAGRRPLSPTFASHCPIHHLCHSRRWLVVAIPAHPAAYQLSHQAEHVFMFPHLDIF